MWSQVVKYTKLFDILLYIPLDKCEDVIVVDDKFRDVNYTYRNQIDSIMKAVFDYLLDAGSNINVIYGSRETRVDTFMNVILQLYNNELRIKYSIDEFSKLVDGISKGRGL